MEDREAHRYSQDESEDDGVYGEESLKEDHEEEEFFNEQEEQAYRDRLSIEADLRLEQQATSGANWFFWIAGLSLVNSLIILSGSNWSFLIGLGVTQFIDAIALALAEDVGMIGKVIGFILDLLAAGIFALFGVFSRKRHQWSFIVGMVLYALDGLIFFLVQDWLSLGFHVYALYCLYRGLAATRALKTIPSTT